MSGPFGLIDVRENHRFDVANLESVLEQYVEGYRRGAWVQQFEGGQSNPTFLLTNDDRRFVVRKKPPGKLLPSAHQVEREFRIYQALADTDVPVPRMYWLCEDDSILGTPFYVMEYIDGRVLSDATLPGLSAHVRRDVYLEMIRVLAALHRVDYQAKGLGDFGKPGNYFLRQTGRWTKQYLAAQTDEIPAMNELIRWLPEHIPDDDTTTIVHGDFQLYNMLYDRKEPKCLALIDWELSTLGNPLADLAYNCMKYHSDELRNHAAGVEGIPSEDEIVAEYCRLTGRTRIDHWNFCMAFSFFRFASIAQGVYKRGLQGNASSASALTLKDRITNAAETALRLASGDAFSR